MVNLGPRKPPSRKGSMTDVPRDLLEQIAQLERLFTVDTAKLKEITAHFVSELDKGLSKTGGSIPMNVTWVFDWPTGQETGTYLALDMGGTNLRVAEISLDGKRSFDVTQSKYQIPEEIKVGKADLLWDFIADCLKKFLLSYHPPEEGKDLEEICLGFTFSFPATQKAINHGVLQTWTKGLDIDGVEGHDVVEQLGEALKRQNVPVKVTAVINDTTGTLVASNYVDSNTKMGVIFGTGCNAAYFEKIKNIPKLEGLLSDEVDPEGYMAINCEWGAFDNEHYILPYTTWDNIIDETSPRPGQQAFEKLIAGVYLGEILRLVLVDLHNDGFLFEGKSIKLLEKSYFLDASFLSMIEEDPWENLSETESLFINKLDIMTTESERKLIRKLAELIGTRSARLSACGVAAIAKKAGYTQCHAGADGSVFNKYPHFKSRGAQALREIFDWKYDDPKDYPIKIVPAEDGSGVGAALIAALTDKRIEKGLSVGITKKN